MKKKFTMLFAALTLFMGAAVAQVQEGMAYYLKVANLEGYIDAKTGHSDTSGPTVAVSASPVKVYFKASTDGKWKISVNENLEGGFLKVNKWCANPNSTEDGQTDWSFIAVDGEANLYYFSQGYHQSGNGTYLGNSGSVAIGTKLYTDQAVANAVKVQFVEATQPTTTVTYTFKYGEKTIATQESNEVIIGGAFPEITAVFPMGVVATKPAGNVSEENADQIIEVSIDNSKLPFVAAEDYESIEHWYYMNIRDIDPTYAYYDSSISYIKADKAAIDKKNKDVYSWAFIGNPIDGFSIVNKAAGETMVLSSPVAPNTDADAGQVARMVTKVGATGNLVWSIMPPTHGGAPAGAFYVQHPTATSYAFNRQGFSGGNALCYWNNRDTGSSMQVVERIMGAVADLEDLLADAEALQTTVNGNIGTKIGEYTQATADALSAAITAAESIVEAETAKAEDVATLQAAMDAVKMNLPTVGQYYQIHSSLDKFATEQGAEIVKAVYSNGTQPRWKTLNDDDKTFYWLAVAAEGGNVVFQNAADGKYMVANANQSGAWSMADAPTAASNISVKIFSKEENAKGYEYGVIMNNWQMHCNGHTEGKGVESNIVSWNTNQANSASSWFLVPVPLPTFYTVTYNFQLGGDTKYTQTAELVPGAAFPAMNVVLPYGVTSNFALPEGTVSEDVVKNFALTVEHELPFVAAADVNNITTWYYAQMHANSSVTAYVQDDQNANNNVDWNDKSVDAAEINSHLWGFVGDVWSGIKMVNKGTGRAIVSTSGSAVMGVAANATAFIPTYSNGAYSEWFCLKYPESNYLNASGDQSKGEGKINSYGNPDNGSSFKLTKYQEKTVTISEADYSTLYLDYATYIPAGVEVYAVSAIENGYVALEAVEGDVLPANTGVILKNKGEYNFVAAGVAAGATASVTSLLSGSATDTYVEGTAYVLANGTQGVGLYKAELNKAANGAEGTTHFKNNANKAYLVLPAQAGAPAMFSLGRGEGTTGVETAVSGEQTVVIYDLSGRRVEKMEKGIYIVNGKKVIR